MLRYCIVSVVNGILFGILDGIIHANPVAIRLFEAYAPIARSTINAPAGIVIDMAYGFVMGFVFLLVYESLPGEPGVVKGIVFALIVWFFRVLMSAVTQWMMFEVPVTTLLYVTIAGLVEMLVIGIVYGLFLRPFHRQDR